MRCRDVQSLVTRYVDGELDDARASALRGHLRGCPACQARVEDEALVRDAGADLGPVDPPAELWQGIQQRLAAEEVADAERSRAWLWWQRLRPHALTATVGVAAVAVLAVWLLRRGGDDETAAIEPGGEKAERVALEETSPPSRLPVPPADPVGPGQLVRSFEEARAAELVKADATYHDVIDELRQIIAEERAGWPADAARRFDARLAALEAEAGRHRRAAGAGPAGRDPLYATLRAQIALLERAAMGELPR